MSNVPIKEIMIIGPNIPDSELHTLSSQEGVLCIGDGKSEITAALIKEKLQGIMLADKFRVDINAHGNRDNQKQQIIWLNSFPLKTEDFLKVFKTLLTHDSGKQELTGEWHLWSCFGGSTNKATHILGKNNSLITHIDSKNPSDVALTNYTIKKSIENYLENPKKEPYQRWIEDKKYSFEPSTFNFNPTSGPNYTTHLKSARTLKPEILKDIVKKFKHTNDLTAVFTDFIAEDIRKIENSKEFRMLKAQGYFKTNFKASDEIKIELSNEEAKNLALGIAIYLSGKTMENQGFDIFKEYIHNIKQHGVDLDSNVLGTTPLVIAAQEGHTEIVKELIARGVDVNQADAKGITALLMAAQEGHTEIVKELLTHEADVNQADAKGTTALLMAAQERYIEIVKELLTHEADVNQADAKGITPLMVAARKGHIEIVKELLTHEADVNQADAKGTTPLFMAAGNGYVKIVQELIARKANVNQADAKGTTPLYAAVYSGSTEIMKELLTHGADVNQADAKGITLLYAAVYAGSTEIMKELLTHGVDADLISIQCFQKANIDIDTPAKDGSTLLLRAIKNGQTKIVEALLGAGADPNKANSKDSTTPLQAAMSTKNQSIVQLIIDYTPKEQKVEKTTAPAPSRSVDKGIRR